jgi:hypothetical protein
MFSRSSKAAILIGGSLGFAVLGLGSLGHADVIYNGNGMTGFGGPVGPGNVDISDDGTNITLTLNRGPGSLNDDLVIYIDSVAGGFPDTSTFFDNGDGGRTAISGFNGGNPSRTLVTFPSGFEADYALSIENSFIGLFGLASGGNNSLNYITGQGQSGNNNAPTFTITFPITALGITAGQSFNFVGTLDASSAYRSNEAIGPSNAPGGNLGFTGELDFSGWDTYTTTPVPEPASLAMLGGLATLLTFRRRKA